MFNKNIDLVGQSDLLKEAQERTSNSDRSNNQLKVEIEKNTGILKTLKKDIEKNDKSLFRKVDDLDEINKKIDEVENSYNDLKETVDERKTVIMAEMEDIEKDFKIKKNDLTRRTAEATDNYNVIKEKNTAIIDSYADTVVKADRQANKSEIKRLGLQEKIDSAESTLSSLSSDITEKREIVKNLKEKEDKIKKSIERKEKDVLDYNNKISDYQYRLKIIIENKQSLLSGIKGLNKDLEVLVVKITESQTKFDKVENERFSIAEQKEAIARSARQIKALYKKANVRIPSNIDEIETSEVKETK